MTDIEEVKDALYDELKESKVQANVAKIFEQIKKQTIVDNYLTQTSNRPERKANAAGPTGAIQPASATQSKTGSSQVRPANSASAPTKSAQK